MPTEVMEANLEVGRELALCKSLFFPMRTLTRNPILVVSPKSCSSLATRNPLRLVKTSTRNPTLLATQNPTLVVDTKFPSALDSKSDSSLVTRTSAATLLPEPHFPPSVYRNPLWRFCPKRWFFSRDPKPGSSLSTQKIRNPPRRRRKRRRWGLLRGDQPPRFRCNGAPHQKMVSIEIPH